MFTYIIIGIVVTIVNTSCALENGGLVFRFDEWDRILGHVLGLLLVTALWPASVVFHIYNIIKNIT